MCLRLQSLLTDEQIAAAPVLILGNKIDLPGAASEDELRHMFGLHGQTTGRVSLIIVLWLSMGLVKTLMLFCFFKEGRGTQ